VRAQCERYPSARGYGPPAAAPMPAAAPTTYALAPAAAPYAAVPMAMAAPSVIPPGHFGKMMGHLGRRLESYSWPRVQPPQVAYSAPAPMAYMAMPAPVMQVAYVPVAQYAAPQP